LKEEIDNLGAIELAAMYDKYYLSMRKQVEFFWTTQPDPAGTRLSHHQILARFGVLRD
jgi:hypothetical protein